MINYIWKLVEWYNGSIQAKSPHFALLYRTLFFSDFKIPDFVDEEKNFINAQKRPWKWSEIKNCKIKFIHLEFNKK